MTDFFELPAAECLAVEHDAYRNSVDWHDDRIAEILHEREEQGIDPAESSPAVARLVRQGIQSIEEGVPSTLFIALLHTLAAHAADELDSALRAVSATEKIKLANRDPERAKALALKMAEVRQAWQARLHNPEHGHRFSSVPAKRHFNLFVQFVVPDLDPRTVKRYLQARPDLLHFSLS